MKDIRMNHNTKLKHTINQELKYKGTKYIIKGDNITSLLYGHSVGKTIASMDGVEAPCSKRVLTP